MHSNAALVNGYTAYMRDTLHRSPSTIYTYHRRFMGLLDFLGDKPFAMVTIADLNAFCSRPRRESKLRGPAAADATVRGDVQLLRALWKYLFEIVEAVPRNPALKLVAPRVHNDQPHPVPAEVWRRLWFSALADHERVALGLAYFCGFRRAEVTGLRADQFTDAPYPVVTAVLRKGGRRTGGFRWRSCLDLYEARLPELVGDAEELFVLPLRRLRGARAHRPALLPWADDRKMQHAAPYRHQPPFDGFVAPDRFNKQLDRITRRLHLPKVAPHDLRHSFCTNLCSPRGGVPVEVVSKLAGHTDVRITMRYVDIGQDPLADLLAHGSTRGDIEPVERWG